MDKTISLLDEGWKFKLVCSSVSGGYDPNSDKTADAWYKGFDDSDFENVTIPHDWSVSYPFDRRNSSGTGYLNGGIAWYRLHFNLPEEYRGKRLSVHFDGVYKNSRVWINSYDLGRHPNGYTPFSYDITEFARFGDDENVLCVRVSHMDIADSRWFTGSGITRKVCLIAEENVHATEDGTYTETAAVDTDHAMITVHHECVNDSEKDAAFSAVARIYDAAGKMITEQVKDVAVPAGDTETFSFDISLDKPRFWCTEDPYLYTLDIVYRTGDGEYTACSERFGVRTIRFDPDNGFFLNGRNMKLNGVCVHHDAGVLGAAVTKDVWRRRLAKLSECGCNAIRCSHNPHMPELYDLCDEMGFLVMDEAFDEWETPKNKWSTGHNVFPPKHQGYAEYFKEWHDIDLKAMVRRDRVHPSVIMWSIGNEIDYPNDPYCHVSFEVMTGNNDAGKSMSWRKYDPDKPDATRMLPIAKELAAIVKSEDTSRPVTMALAFPELSTKLGILKYLDVAGYNYKEMFYEEDHKTFSEIPFLGSENGHDYKAWKAVEDNPYISGQFLWTGIDYLGEAHGWPAHGSGAGLIDLAGYEKHRFLARKSYWLNSPVVEIATRVKSESENEWLPCTESWNYEKGQTISIRCYSNQPWVRLYLNDRLISEQKGYNAEGWYQFYADFEPGVLRAEGLDKDGNKACEKVISTTGKASLISAKEWTYAGMPEGEKGYIYQVEITLLDVKGNRAVSDDKVIKASVIGPGEFLGFENGDLSDNTSYADNKRKTMKGRLLAYIRRTEPGTIELHLTSEDLKDEKTVISIT